MTLGEVAQTYVDAGKFDDAIKWYRRVIEVDTVTDTKADTFARIGILQWRRLNNHPEVASVARLKIADEGIDALQQANELRAGHPNTLTYWNLLYRERALASEASYARAIDTASALAYQKQAMDAMKAAQAASNSSGGQAPKDPKAPPPKK